MNSFDLRNAILKIFNDICVSMNGDINSLYDFILDEFVKLGVDPRIVYSEWGNLLKTIMKKDNPDVILEKFINNILNDEEMLLAKKEYEYMLKNNRKQESIFLLKERYSKLRNFKKLFSKNPNKIDFDKLSIDEIDKMYSNVVSKK